MKDPVQCPTQGHNFCRQCVLQHLDLSETCPTCREPLQVDKLVPNRGLLSLIEDAEVYCIFYDSLQEDVIKKRKRKEEESCDWTGKLKETERHNSECQFALINCPQNGCDLIYRRKLLPGHSLRCLHRLVPCKWCNLMTKFNVMDAHLQVCLHRPVPCPNSCLDENGAVLCCISSKLTHHLTLCSMTLIVCKFAVAGCEIKLTRKDMPSHEDDSGAHMSYLLDSLQTAQLRIRQLDRSQLTAQAQISHLQEHSRTQARLIDTLTSEVENTKLIFKIRVSLLGRRNRSTDINVNGHRFTLLLYPNFENHDWHSLQLSLSRDDDRVRPSTVTVDSEFQLVSYSANHPAINIPFRQVYEDAESWSRIKFIETRLLESPWHEKDGTITIVAKIRVVP
jgi:hypothetical protein